MKNLKFLFLTLLATSVMVSCSDDDDNPPPPINEEEVITTLRLTLTPQGAGTIVPIVFLSQDLDGDGPNPPVVTTSADLSPNTNYSAEVEVLNELETPADDITIEVLEEDDEHQFFYVISTGANMTVSYDDSDDDGNPIGVETTFVTGDAETGTLTVTLLHEPDKDAAGVSDGDPTNAGGETDATATFDYTVL